MKPFTTPRFVFLLAGLIVAALAIMAVSMKYSADNSQADTAAKTTINETKSDILNVKEGPFLLILADTPALREKGLSGRESLPPDTAMLFVFDQPDFYGFWMKDMKFPIDIIWMDESHKIVHIEKNVRPETYPKVFMPDKKSLYVLETNIHFVEKNGIKVQDTLDFNLSK